MTLQTNVPAVATSADQARAVLEQMYSAIGLARSLHVPPIDVEGLLAWTATLDAYLAQQERPQPDWLGSIAPTVFDAIRHAFLSGYQVGRLLITGNEHAAFGVYLDERRQLAQRDAGA